MKNKIKKMLKKIIYVCKKPFMCVKYINNYIYVNELLVGRTALITGGTSGIGYAIAKTFLLNGANIIITGRNIDKINKAVELLKKCKTNNCKVYGFKMDISDIHNIESDYDYIMNNVDGLTIDILVNNAGIALGENIGNTKVEDYERCMGTNLEGMYFLSQCFFNMWKKQKKHSTKANILNVLSSSSKRPAVAPYVLSKWGAKGLTIGMAKKFIDYDIIVNGIAPGPTATSMQIESDDNLYLDSSPVKRYITPEEVANGALFLVSDMGNMVIGDIMYMTGGAAVITIDDILYN